MRSFFSFFSAGRETARPSPRRKTPSPILVTSVLLLFALIQIYYFRRSITPRPPDFTSQVELGQVVAGTVSQWDDSKGGVLILTCKDDGEKYSVAAWISAATRSFRQAFAGRTVVEELALSSLRLGAPPEAEIPGALFMEILKTHPSEKIVVSFVGAPALTEDQITSLGTEHPRILIVSNEGSGLVPLLEMDLVQTAVLPHSLASAPQSIDPKSSHPEFDRVYRLVTPKDAEALRSELGTPDEYSP